MTQVVQQRLCKKLHGQISVHFLTQTNRNTCATFCTRTKNTISGIIRNGYAGKAEEFIFCFFLKSFFQMHAFKDILCSIFNGFMYYRAVKPVHLDKKHQNDLQIFPEHGTGLALIIGR